MTKQVEAAGIVGTKSSGKRMLIASVLTQDFRRESIIQPGGKSHWRKAIQTP